MWREPVRMGTLGHFTCASDASRIGRSDECILPETAAAFQ